MLEMVQLKHKVKKLQILARSHKRKEFQLNDDIAYYTKVITRNNLAIPNYQLDAKENLALSERDLRNNQNDVITLKEFQAIITKMQWQMRGVKQPVALARIGNFSIEMMFSLGQCRYILRGAASYNITPKKSSMGAVAIFNQVKNVLASIPSAVNNAKDSIANAKERIAGAQQELSTPFNNSKELKEHQNRVREIEQILAGNTEKNEPKAA